jgi:hypothetical protein
VKLHEHQVRPDGEWGSWWILGGRGTGRTHAALVAAIEDAAAGRYVEYRSGHGGGARHAMGLLVDLVDEMDLREKVEKNRLASRRVMFFEGGGVIDFSSNYGGRSIDTAVLDGFDQVDNRIAHYPKGTRGPRELNAPRLEANADGPVQWGPRDLMLQMIASRMRGDTPRLIFTARPSWTWDADVHRTYDLSKSVSTGDTPKSQIPVADYRRAFLGDWADQ